MVVWCTTGPQPAPPRNVTITQSFGGYLISWKAPLGSVPIANYDIEYKAGGPWKKLNKEKIVNETSYTSEFHQIMYPTYHGYQFRLQFQLLFSNDMFMNIN